MLPGASSPPHGIGPYPRQSLSELKPSRMNFPTRLFAGILALMPVPALKAQQTVPLRRSDGQPLQVRAYAPQHSGCRGIALVSPGAGGTEHGYTYLGQALSKQGYLAIVMGHRESGPGALRAHVHGHTRSRMGRGFLAEPDRAACRHACWLQMAGSCRGRSTHEPCRSRNVPPGRGGHAVGDCVISGESFPGRLPEARTARSEP